MARDHSRTSLMIAVLAIVGASLSGCDLKSEGRAVHSNIDDAGREVRQGFRTFKKGWNAAERHARR